MDTSTNDLLLVTTATVPGRQVTDYLGLVSGEARVHIPPVTASRRLSNRHQRRKTLTLDQRVSRARNHAIAEMIQFATNAGATAIIGIAIDYATIRPLEGGNTLIICASGTAVELS